MSKNVSFTTQVYEIVRQIPPGKVATYGQVAQLAGSPGAARAVGSAMKNNPDIPHTPCHRVVGSDGFMHGYAAGGETIKIRMLREEGVKFQGEKVDLKVSGWQ